MNKPTPMDTLYPLGRMLNPGKTHKVFIRDLVVEMLIGVYTHERTTPQPVRFNIDMTVSDAAGPVGDNYRNVVCYETITNQVIRMATDKHVNRVETLAENTAAICLANDRVSMVTVKIEKLSAIKNTSSVGVEITRVKG